MTEGAWGGWFRSLWAPSLRPKTVVKDWHHQRGFLDIPVTPYWTRHTAITYSLIFNGGNYHFVQKFIAFHTRVSMTERYSQLSVDVTMQLTEDQRRRFVPVFLREEADEYRAGLMRALEQKERELSAALDRIAGLERMPSAWRRRSATSRRC